jgi:imidazole glycerol-phosphate synthase subunit HisH
VRLALIDLGFGNLGSVAMAFERLGVTPERTSDAETIAAADKVVLPGVGHAGYAMRQIEARGMTGLLRDLRQPLLGICLGMQLMFERSDEDGVECLGLLPGSVRALEAAPGRPVPHMGWSVLEVDDERIGLKSGEHVYFAHSFACDDGEATVARTAYGRSVPAVVRSGNRIGAQFHPERSSAPGRRFLEAWLAS